MEGLFYCASVHSIGLLQKFIPVSQALSEEQVEAPLDNAYDMFIRPLLGDTLSDHFRDLTKKLETEDYDMSEEETKVMAMLRRATANLAFWYSFTELNTHITDQGFQRSEGETYKPIYRYQELELKMQFRNKGFNALDELLRYMQEHTMEFPDYTDAPAYIDMQGSLVRGAQEIDRYYYVNGSYLVFLKLRPAFRRIMELFVVPVIGTDACTELYAYLNGTVDDAEEVKRLEDFRKTVAAAVICKALAEHVRNIGSITDRGLYYSNIQANAQENQNENPAGDRERERQATQLFHTAERYLHRAIRWVEENMPEKFKGHPEDAYNRDNDHKHTFWA